MDSFVKEICQRRGWSKYKLAKELGVSWNTIHFWAKGIWKPNKQNFGKIKRLLNV